MREPRLAIDGGPMAIPEGPPSWPSPDDEVRQALLAAWKDGSWGRYHGPHTLKLIDRLGTMFGVDYVLPCASGTVAVELALRGVGVAAGDEVILAAYDFPGNFRAVEAIGARPVLVDIDPESWCLDPRHVPAACGPRTKAVIVSHLHGGLAAMRDLVAAARQAGLRIVEDTCQVPGGRVDGQAAGTWGDVGVLSFGGSKLLTAGRGGALLTRHPDVHQRAVIFSERGNNAFPLSELQAAVLVPQLARLPARNAHRRESALRLVSKLQSHTVLRPVADRPDDLPVHTKVVWRFDPTASDRTDRDQLVAAVAAEGVDIGAGFRGFTRRGPRRCRRAGPLDASRAAADRTLLVHHPVLLEGPDIVDRVADALEKVLVALLVPDS